MDKKNLSGSRLSYALYEYLAAQLPELTILPGERNTKDNPNTVIFCNDPVEVLDKEAVGTTFARIEIANRKQDNGLEYFQTTRDASDNVVRWGTIELTDMVLDSITPTDGSDLVIGNYHLNIRAVKKGFKDADYTYVWIILNCVINGNV